MPRYVFLLYAPDEVDQGASARDQDCAAASVQRREFESAVRSVGARVIGGASLLPPGTATTVRREEPDEPAVLRDGPVLDGPDVLTGFYLIDARDHEQALALASTCPAETIEVRSVR